MLNNYIKTYNANYKALITLEEKFENTLKNNGITISYKEYCKDEIEEYSKKIPVRFVFEENSVIIYKKKGAYRFPLKILSQVKNNEKYICLQQLQKYIIFLGTIIDKFNEEQNM